MNHAISPTGDRLARLRDALAGRGLDGFIVPRADEHQGEYVPPSAERLAWISGFDGSAGTALVLADKAALFVDGRYTLQAADQIDTNAFEIHEVPGVQPADWLIGQLQDGGKLGYDPWLHPLRWIEQFRDRLKQRGIELVACEDNPLDAVWRDRPAPPDLPVEAHGLEFAGQASLEKRQSLGKSLTEENIDAAVLTQPDSICWLLNIRGRDVEYTRFVLSFAVLNRDGTVDWFIAPARVPEAVRATLDDGVRLHPPARLAAHLAGLSGRRVRLDPASCAGAIHDMLHRAGAQIDRGADPCELPKACKNETELAGMRRAHRRDGLALTRFLAWLDQAVLAGEPLDERVVAEKLQAFRAADPMFRSPSFDTISGFGPNGAIVHYRATPRTNRRFAPGSLYLVDSGGQYPDGTTDVTRTIAIGAPDPAMRRHFTLVLKGHVAIATARFPDRVRGGQLDGFARRALWAEGLDYAHGTGHGVGSFLSVHEGPQRISSASHGPVLKPGMILSNEPGYYKEGAYGIRIENLVAVVSLPSPDGAMRPLLGFETLTLAPIDRRLIDVSLLSAEEIAWVDAYHASVKAAHFGALTPAEQDWLTAATAPLAVPG